MRILILSTALGLAFTGTAVAQAPKPGGPVAPNSVVATVNADAIHMSDVAQAVGQLPPEVRQQMPPEMLYAKVLDQLVSRKALLIQARKQGLDKDPAIQRQMQAAADQVLQTVALQRAVLPKVNEEAIKAAYDKQYAGKPGETEVHARHILVDTQAKAQDIIKQLDDGAKFEDLAKKYGDPKDAATQQGGDLGFFKKGDMLPEFSEVAFKLKPKEYTHTPVHTRYGWHVIQVLETRVATPPTYEQERDQIRQQLLQADVAAAVAQAKSGAKIVMFNADGSPVKPGQQPGMPATKPAAPPAKK
jgi:peptidyl-prolyl cis-trans isomerase C